MTLPRPRRWLLFVEASVCTLVVRVALRLVPLESAARLAARAVSPFRTSAPAHACMDAARRSTERWSHATCLYRALTAYVLLARRDPTARFHVGVADRHGLAAHAWVTLGGRTADAEAADYFRMWTAPPLRTGS